MANEKYPDGFTWSKKTRRYRNAATGKFIRNSLIQDLRDEFIGTQVGFVESLATGLADGTFTLSRWEEELFDRIKLTYESEFLAGRGGRNALTASDKRAIGQMLKRQRTFLRGFAEEIAEGGFSEAMVRARSLLYINSASQAFERGKATAWDVRLPAYPGDGSTVCMSSCKCHWSISERVDRVNAYWKLATAENCDDCLDRGIRWSPYTVFKS